MNNRTKKGSALVVCLVSASLGLSLILPVRGDDGDRELVKDAHKQLAAALNLGGDTPNDADRTTAINAAISDLKDITFEYGRGAWARDVAVKDLKSALDMIARGDPAHDVEGKIRDADSIVRDLES